MWLEKFAYKESGPHLLLMAFLQRIINGVLRDASSEAPQDERGKIHREYALGRGRVDLRIDWKTQSIVIELKVWRGPKTEAEGLPQITEYMDTCNATEGHLVIFDRRSEKNWDEKIYDKVEQIGNKTIHVWGM